MCACAHMRLQINAYKNKARLLCTGGTKVTGLNHEPIVAYRVYIIIIVIFNSTALKTVYVSARRSIFYSHEHVAVCI